MIDNDIDEYGLNSLMRELFALKDNKSLSNEEETHLKNLLKNTSLSHLDNEGDHILNFICLNKKFFFLLSDIDILNINNIENSLDLRSFMDVLSNQDFLHLIKVSNLQKYRPDYLLEIMDFVNDKTEKDYADIYHKLNEVGKERFFYSVLKKQPLNNTMIKFLQQIEHDIVLYKDKDYIYYAQDPSLPDSIVNKIYDNLSSYNLEDFLKNLKFSFKEKNKIQYKIHEEKIIKKIQTIDFDLTETFYQDFCDYCFRFYEDAFNLQSPLISTILEKIYEHYKREDGFLFFDNIAQNFYKLGNPLYFNCLLDNKITTKYFSPFYYALQFPENLNNSKSEIFFNKYTSYIKEEFISLTEMSKIFELQKYFPENIEPILAEKIKNLSYKKLENILSVKEINYDFFHFVFSNLQPKKSHIFLIEKIKKQESLSIFYEKHILDKNTLNPKTKQPTFKI